MVISDYFTKWKEAFPTKDMEAATVAKHLVDEVICCLGVPDTIHTNEGKILILYSPKKFVSYWG